MRKILAACAIVVGMLASLAPGRAQDDKAQDDSGAVKFYIMIDVPDLTNLWELDRWYMTYHSQQMHRAMRIWQKNYISFRSYIVPDDVAKRYNVWRGRMTEIYYDKMADFHEGRKNNPFLDLLNPPPGGWVHTVFRSQPVTVPVNPQEVYLRGSTPPKETPYFRWVIFFRYPDGVSEAEGDKWFLDTHVKEVAKIPGLRKYFGYRTIGGEDENDSTSSSVKIPKGRRPVYTRVEELWFDDYASWKAAFIDNPLKFSSPPWGGTFPYVDYISTFIGESPDVDFINDKRVIP